MSNKENIDLAYKMIEMHCAHTQGWVDACYHPKCEWIELAISGQTKGRRGGIDTLRAAAMEAARIFPSIKIVVSNIVSDGDRVALEIDFEGTMAKKEGVNKPARTSALKMAIFLTFQEGLIIRQVDYPVSVS